MLRLSLDDLIAISRKNIKNKLCGNKKGQFFNNNKILNEKYFNDYKRLQLMMREMDSLNNLLNGVKKCNFQPFFCSICDSRWVKTAVMLHKISDAMYAIDWFRSVAARCKR